MSLGYSNSFGGGRRRKRLNAFPQAPSDQTVKPQPIEQRAPKNLRKRRRSNDDDPSIG